MTTIIVLVAIAVVIALTIWRFPAVRQVIGGAVGTAVHTIIVRLILLAAVIVGIAVLATYC